MISRRGGVPCKVLIVEDDEGVAMMLRFCLQRAGFDVVRFPAGNQALRALDERAPDAVVLDIGLPNSRTGVFLDRLMEIEREEDSAPVWVALSALDRGEVARLYGPLEGHFLAKPFDPWDLVRSLGKMLSAKDGR